MRGGSAPNGGDFKGTAVSARRGRAPVAAAGCTCGGRGGGVTPSGAGAGSVVVDGELPEARLELYRLSRSRCQRWSPGRQVQAIQNGADHFGILDGRQVPEPPATARTRECIGSEHSLEQLGPREPACAWARWVGGLRSRSSKLGSGLAGDRRLSFTPTLAVGVVGRGALRSVVVLGAGPRGSSGWPIAAAFRAHTVHLRLGHACCPRVR